MFETHGGTRNRTRDLPKKGSAFITSSDHWTSRSRWCVFKFEGRPGLSVWLTPLCEGGSASHYLCTCVVCLWHACKVHGAGAQGCCAGGCSAVDLWFDVAVESIICDYAVISDLCRWKLWLVVAGHGLYCVVILLAFKASVAFSV